MLVLFKIFPISREYRPAYEKENDFTRIASINGIGALLLAPLFAVALYFFKAPSIYIYLSLSYTAAFPVYAVICGLIPFFRDKLLYFIFFHLFLLSFITFQQMQFNDFRHTEFYYFLWFYIFSIIIIQRLYATVLYHIFVVILFLNAYPDAVNSPINIKALIPLFMLFGLSTILMIYARGKMIHNIEDYSDYLKKIMNNPGSGYVLFDLSKKKKVIDYNEEAGRYFISENNGQGLEELFFSVFKSEELDRIKRIKIGTRYLKNITLERFKQKLDIEIKVVLISLKNNIYWLAHLNDVTVQNKKRTELEMSERKYRNLYHKNKAGVFTIDEKSLIIDGNESFFKMFDDTLEKGDVLFTPENSKDWEIILEALNVSGSIQNYQTQFYLRNGVTKTYIFSWYLDNQTKYIEGSVIDLTHIQKTAQALKQSEQKYRLIFEESNDAILLLTGDHIIDANRKALQLFNLTDKQIRNKELFDLSWNTGFDSAKDYQQIRSNLSQRRNIKFNWLLRSNNQQVEAEIVLIEIMLENKLYYQCVIHDLTEQNKLAKEKLRAEFAEETNIRLAAEIKDRINAEKMLQEQFLRTKAILDSSANTFLITLTLDKEVSSFNSHCKEYFSNLFNIKIKEGVRFTSYFKERIDAKNIRLFERYLHQVANGRSHQMEVQIYSEKINEFWMEVYMSPIFDTEGNVAEISLVAHDISEKKKASIEIEESLKEKEVLLKEIHHRVKNNLQVISSILNLQSSFVQDEKTLSILQESRNRIRSMAIIHENLYKTEDFSTIKFGEYLQNLSANLIASYRISGEVRLSAGINNVDLVLDQAIPCGLLVNEIITNALKYAWDNEKDRVISIKLLQKKTQVILEISDNGKGLPRPFREMNSDTLGLQLIITLAEQLDGDLSVDIRKGTKYLLKFDNIKPLNNVKN